MLQLAFQLLISGLISCTLWLQVTSIVGSVCSRVQIFWFHAVHAMVAGEERVAVSTLLACGRVHHHLVAKKKRMLAGLLLETGEARDVHHMCTLLGYGADAICPYLAMEVIVALQEDGKVDGRASRLDLINNYIKVSI